MPCSQTKTPKWRTMLLALTSAPRRISLSAALSLHVCTAASNGVSPNCTRKALQMTKTNAG